MNKRIRKAAIVLLLLMIALQRSFAQENYSITEFLAKRKAEKKVAQIEMNTFRMGLKTGFNLSTYTKGFDYRPNIHLGMAFEIPLSLNWFIMPEIYYINKGGRKSVDDVFYGLNAYGYKMWVTGKFYSSPSYIDVPLMVGYKHWIDEDMNLYAAIGPYVSYGVGGKLKLESAGESRKYDLYDDCGFNRWNYGLNMELGYNYEGLNLALGIDYGLSDIIGVTPTTKNNNIVSYSYDYNTSTKKTIDKDVQIGYKEMRHLVFKFSLGYFFKL